MNFLAHLYCSGSSTRRMIGNFIGDFVKGSDLSAFEPEVASGILLHRAIDEFTDRHDFVRQSKKRLQPAHGHYAGVVVDIFYDHFLAHRWSNYHDMPLDQFASAAYRTILEYQLPLPEQVHRMLPYMIKGNWLVGYTNLEGVRRSLQGISRRTKFHPHLETAVEELQTHYDQFESEFIAFMPRLKSFAEDWIQENENP